MRGCCSWARGAKEERHHDLALKFLVNQQKVYNSGFLPISGSFMNLETFKSTALVPKKTCLVR